MYHHLQCRPYKGHRKIRINLDCRCTGVIPRVLVVLITQTILDINLNIYGLLSGRTFHGQNMDLYQAKDRYNEISNRLCHRFMQMSLDYSCISDHSHGLSLQINMIDKINLLLKCQRRSCVLFKGYKYIEIFFFLIQINSNSKACISTCYTCELQLSPIKYQHTHQPIPLVLCSVCLRSVIL